MGSSASKQQKANKGTNATAANDANSNALDPTTEGAHPDSSQVTTTSTQASSAIITDPDSQPSIDHDRHPTTSNPSRPPSSTQTSTSVSAPTDSDRPSSHSDTKSISNQPQEESTSQDANQQHEQEQEQAQRVETPGIKQVEVISVNVPESYADDTNQTGLSHHEMKIIDSFYSSPERTRTKAYIEAKQAAQQRRASRKAAKEARRKSKRNNQQETQEPTNIECAMDNTRKLGILNLSKMNLAKIPDEVFESMPGTARFINISFNQLSVLDVRLCDYVLVQRLTANGNQLTSIPSTISRMTALKKLDLANNHLTELPDSFAGMKFLEHVDLSYNQLSSLPDSFVTLNLTALNLSHNKFNQAPVEISSMEWLMDLDLSSNLLTRIPLEYMALRQLISFNLDHNQLVDFPNEILQACTGLVTLRLRSNPITMSILQEKPAFHPFDTRRKLKLKRQLDAGTIAETDLIPADS